MLQGFPKENDKDYDIDKDGQLNKYIWNVIHQYIRTVRASYVDMRLYVGLTPH